MFVFNFCFSIQFVLHFLNYFLGKQGLYAKIIQNGCDEVNKSVLLAQVFQLLI